MNKRHSTTLHLLIPTILLFSTFSKAQQDSTFTMVPIGTEAFEVQSFLMLMANTDERNYTKEEAQQLHNFIMSDTKELIFYESGHILPGEWISKAVEWMAKYLR